MKRKSRNRILFEIVVVLLIFTFLALGNALSRDEIRENIVTEISAIKNGSFFVNSGESEEKP